MVDSSEVVFKRVPIERMEPYWEGMESLLSGYELSVDGGVNHFLLGLHDKKVVACAGLDQNIIKCVAIGPKLRNTQISLTLIQEVIHLAAEKGLHHLFLYTAPSNQDFFRGAGFYPISEVPNHVLLMENTPVGISRYCDELRQTRHAGSHIGAVVLNANPFTLGHRYLIEQAAQASDWLHVFVVQEDLSTFKYTDRLKLVREGVQGVANVTVHGGSPYMISKATFPTYFIKEKENVGKFSTALDLLIFREHIVPALGITHRYVGSEPFCAVTNQYNADMRYWLQEPDLSKAPAIEVVQIERRDVDGKLISASAVRKALREKNYALVQAMVPVSTWEFLNKSLG